MKLAVTDAPMHHLPVWPRPTAAALYRLVGLTIAVGVPTLFWTLALMLMAKALGFAVGAPALAILGLIVVAWCLVGAALAMGKRR
jgi:hypothetical protein